MVFLEIKYQHGWLLPENKEKIKNTFQSGEVSTKRKNVKVNRRRILRKRYLDWIKRMRMNNLLISRVILKEKAINYAQELQVEEFHASNRWFERWKARFNVEAATKGVLWKKVFLKISQNLLENTCARASFLIKLQASGLQRY